MLPTSPQPVGLPSGSFGGRRSRAGAGPWQWRRLAAEPHHLAFGAGALLMSVALLWWAGVQLARATGLVLPWAVPHATAHALLLSLGVLPLFIVGLAFSAGPRWLRVPALPGQALALPLAGMLGGWALALVGLHASTALAAAGMALAAGGLALIAGRFAVLLLGSRERDRDHAQLLLLGLVVMTLAQWVAAVALALKADTVALAAVQAALWGGLGLSFVAVSHRLLPSFTGQVLPAQAAWRSRVLLVALSLLLGLRAPFAAAEALNGDVLTGLAAALCAGLELTGGLLLFWLSLRWGLRASLGARGGAARLLTLLHLGYAWLAVAFTLGGVSHTLMFASAGQLSLGQAPLHAFTMGFLGSTLLVLATRAALEQAGRPLVADHWTWVLCWTVQAGVALRVLAALFPVAGRPLVLLALQFWVLAVVTWAVRYLNGFGRLSRHAVDD